MTVELPTYQLEQLADMIAARLQPQQPATDRPSPARQHQLEQQAKSDLAALRQKKAMKPIGKVRAKR